MDIFGKVLVKFFVSLGVQWLFLILRECFHDVFGVVRLEQIDTLLEIYKELKAVSGLFERLDDVLFDVAQF